MNDYERRLEEARLARMQGIRRTDGVVPPRTPQKNRIEEVLQSKGASQVREPASYIPPITRTEHQVEEAAPVLEPVAEKKQGSYGRFLRNLFLSLIVIILLIGGGYVAYEKYYIHPQASASSDVIAKVGKLVELPAGETPTVATVSDLAPLKDEPFFKEAEIGDKVLIFSTSKKAILYRPSTNKVITVAPLNQ